MSCASINAVAIGVNTCTRIYLQVIQKLSISMREDRSLNSWRVFSIFGGCLMAMYTPTYAFVFYRRYIVWADVPVYLLGWVVSAYSMYAFIRVLQFPIVCFFENYMLMETLSYVALKPGNLKQLANWRALRHHYITYVMPVNYGQTQWAFLSSLSVGVLTLAAVVACVWVYDIGALTQLGAQMSMVVACTAGGVTYTLMTKAVRVWYAQVNHISFLQDLKFDVRRVYFENKDHSQDSSDMMNKNLEIIGELVEFIKEFDEPPSVLGTYFDIHVKGP